MGGLGNVRRGGRSPPLMIGALIACILLLGFNYWMSSSRNLELQTKLYDLEGQMRREAAERGVAEMKNNEFQEEIQKQKEQMSHMESLFKRQLEGSQNICSQEKGTMQQNISSSTKTIQELKGQLIQLNDDLGKLQTKLQSCLGNIKTLNDKLTFEMKHCDSQVLSQKELCDKRVASAKLEVQRNMEKLVPHPVVSLHENAVDGPVEEGETVITVADAVKTSTDVGFTPSVSQSKEKDPPVLPTLKIIEDKGPDAPVDLLSVKDSALKEPQFVPSAVAVKKDIVLPAEGAVTTKKDEEDTIKLLDNNLPEDRGMELMDAHEEDSLTADLDEELADYNGDDENEGEFEADKQAELAQI